MTNEEQGAPFVVLCRITEVRFQDDLAHGLLVLTELRAMEIALQELGDHDVFRHTAQQAHRGQRTNGCLHLWVSQRTDEERDSHRDEEQNEQNKLNEDDLEN